MVSSESWNKITLILKIKMKKKVEEEINQYVHDIHKNS